MPFRHWVKGIYENFSRRYKFVADAPGAHMYNGKGRYVIRYNGTQRATLNLYDYTGDRIEVRTGGHFDISVELEYNKEYHFTVTGLPYSTDPFEVRIDYYNYIATDSSFYDCSYEYVDIPQDGNIGTSITYMGYHMITSQSSRQYKLKNHAKNNNRYFVSKPEYYSIIDGRIVIAAKPNIGNELAVSIGDYVNVAFMTESGNVVIYKCIIGDYKGSDASSIWGHDNGQSVVEIIYHDYSPTEEYDGNVNNPWGSGRVIKIIKVGNYGNFE